MTTLHQRHPNIPKLRSDKIRPGLSANYSSCAPIIASDKNNTQDVCIDFRDLNKATPKDEYPMPLVDMLINEASGHRVISFLDGNAGYNQISMAEEDRLKRLLDVLVSLICLSGLS